MACGRVPAVALASAVAPVPLVSAVAPVPDIAPVPASRPAMLPR